ncbi:MAG: hypothetical protein JOY51_05590 [Nevskia sp.]|nr:hypothetical protein [Nevskia sp.]
MIEPLNQVATGLEPIQPQQQLRAPERDASAPAGAPQAFGGDLFSLSLRQAPVAAVSSGLKEYVYPDTGREPVVDAINGAKKSVDVEMYLLSDKDIVDSLAAAAKRGVQVRVLMESHPFGSGAGNKKTMDTLQQAGIEARWTSRKFTYTHEKGMVVDGSTAWIMTANMTKSARLNNREYLIADTNSADVQEVQNIFASDWQQTPYVPGAAAGHMVISPVNSRRQLMSLIDSAQQSLRLEDEEMGDKQVVDALVAKAKDGVKVQVLLQQPSSAESGPQPAGTMSTAQAAQALQDGGCDVEYISKPYLHAKSIVADGQTVYLGSINLTANSMDKNRELGILIDQSDIVQGTLRVMQQDWQAGSPISN